MLGDAYHALGRIADAQAAYQRVLLDPSSQGTIDRQLVQWKALDLPELEPEPELEVEPEAAVETSEPEPEVSE